MDLVINPETGHVSPQLHVVFEDGLSTVSFMREVKIPPDCKYLMQRSSQIGTPEQSI